MSKSVYHRSIMMYVGIGWPSDRWHALSDKNNAAPHPLSRGKKGEV